MTILDGLVVLSTLFTVGLLLLPSRYNAKEIVTRVRTDSRNGQPEKVKKSIDGSGPRTTVQVVVLGDIGRSPRMQYHAISIAKHGGFVDLIGYRDSDVHPALQSRASVNLVPLNPAPRALSTWPFVLAAPIKVLWQTCDLYVALAYRCKGAQWMLVQNPPAIPTLLVAKAVCLLRNTKLVVDWHNFGYSILALKLGTEHKLVSMSEKYESAMARFAAANLAVTNAMARILKERYNISAVALHDRPAYQFKPLLADDRETFLKNLPEAIEKSESIKSGRCRLLVSSTSWTPDEDFSILLSALESYALEAASNSYLPEILAIITGKGPLKQKYMRDVDSLSREGKLKKVQVKSAWLSTKDYALLLGAADLGVSLHTSSSGVDLPMKVVDMFGSGLPVVGWSRYEAWRELVQEGVNGKGFQSSTELTKLLTSLFHQNSVELKELRNGAMQECSRRWDDEWDPVAGKLFHLV